MSLLTCACLGASRYVEGVDLVDAYNDLLSHADEPGFEDRHWRSTQLVLRQLLQVCSKLSVLCCACIIGDAAYSAADYSIQLRCVSDASQTEQRNLFREPITWYVMFSHK